MTVRTLLTALALLFAVAPVAHAQRALLTADLQMFVSPSGVDAGNNCTIYTSPCQTIQHAADTTKGQIDVGAFFVYANLIAPGNYAGFLVFNPFVGGGNYNAAYPYLQAPFIVRAADVVGGIPVVNTALNRVITSPVMAAANAVLGIEWVKFQNTTTLGPALKAAMGGHILRGFVEFGWLDTTTQGSAHQYMCHGGRISTYGGANISGGAWAHSFAERQANLEDYGLPTWTDAIIAPAGFTAGFLVAGDQGFLLVNNKTYTGLSYITSATKQGSVYDGGGIQTWGTTGSVPGNGWVGIGSNGSWVN